MIDRLWAIKYPAMALERVPTYVPYTDGDMMWDAVTHLVTPRFLFPDKAELISDSELVRKYAGANVAGAESNTSIAFGYAAESYVDFGMPWMFVPAIVYGFLIGVAFQVWMSVIHHRELAVGVTTVMFWLALVSVRTFVGENARRHPHPDGLSRRVRLSRSTNGC